MPGAPLVSIGILSYNQPADLRRAIESVLQQSYTHLEILISDNASQTGESIDVIREYAAADARIKPFFHKENRGPHFNLEFLVQQATGEFFCWLAGDDAYSPSYIEDCVGALLANGGAVLAANMPVVVGATPQRLPKYIPDTAGLPLTDKYLITVDHIFTDINLFYYSLIRLNVLRKCSLHLKKLFGGDQLLLLELLAFGDLAINTARPGYRYTIHEGQISASPLRYRQVVLANGAGFIERRVFFTAHIGYMMAIVWRRKELSCLNRLRIIRKIMGNHIRSKRYRMIKYDLGINGIVQAIKRLFKKKPGVLVV